MDALETAFAVAVVAVLVGSVTAPFVVAAPDEDAESFDLDGERTATTPPVADEAVATVDGARYGSAQAAIDAAEPGDVVVLEGRFDDRLAVNTSDVTVRAGEGGAVVDAGGEGDVLYVGAANVTVAGLWLRNSGYDAGREDAGVYLAGAANATTLRDLHLTEVTFGVWVNGADRVTIDECRIEGREDVFPRTDRGNGINLWETANSTIRDTAITDVRDGIYYGWAEHVVATNNTLWDNRYGVHYMYSNDNRLEDNLAVDNDVGYALMVSDRLTLVDNTAARNDGTSGHGILLKDIEHSTVRGNTLVENGNGLYVYNAQDNRIADNLVLRNRVGIHLTADSNDQTVVGNSFVHNRDPVLTTTRTLLVWNDSDGGNYWSGARTADLDGDGTSEARHRPAGLVEHLAARQPQTRVFAASPALDAVRLAESSFPVVESPGVVDRQPLAASPHDWRQYADHS